MFDSEKRGVQEKTHALIVGDNGVSVFSQSPLADLNFAMTDIRCREEKGGICLTLCGVAKSYVYLWETV